MCRRGPGRVSVLAGRPCPSGRRCCWGSLWRPQWQLAYCGRLRRKTAAWKAGQKVKRNSVSPFGVGLHSFCLNQNHISLVSSKIPKRISPHLTDSLWPFKARSSVWDYLYNTPMQYDLKFHVRVWQSNALQTYLMQQFYQTHLGRGVKLLFWKARVCTFCKPVQ